MTDEELREKVAEAIRGEPSDLALAWNTLSDVQKQPWRNDADRAIALCREHYGSEIERLKRERGEAYMRGWNEAVEEAASGLHEQCAGLISRHLDLEDEHAGYCLNELSERLRRIRALRKEKGND